MQVACLILQFTISGVLLLSPVFLVQLHPELKMGTLSLCVFVAASVRPPSNIR